MKKIAYFIHGLSAGGAESLVKDYALNLDKSKYTVFIVCINKYNSFLEKLVISNGIKVIFISDLIDKKFNNNWICRFFNKCYMIRKTFKEISPDIIHSHLCINLYVLLADVDSCKIFHTIHSEPSKIWGDFYDFKDLIYKYIDKISAKLLINLKNMRFIVLHNLMRIEIDRMFNVSNSIVVKNGIELTRFKLFKPRDIVRKSLEIPLDALVIGHVGRFTDPKNHLFLIEIFHSIIKKNNNAFLLLIGAGENKHKIMKRIETLGLKDKVKILSNRSDIPDLLNCMNYFVFPSLYEGLPVTLVEAQVVGIPSFISDNITNEVVISNIVSKLSLALSSSAWADFILDYKKPQRIIINDEDWDIQNVVKKLDMIYSDSI